MASTQLWAQALKIGVFDFQKIMRESKTIDSYRQQLYKNLETKRKPLKEKEDAAKLIEEKLRKEGEKLSVNERKSLEERLANEAKELRRLKEDIDMELQKMDRELTQKAFTEISGVIKKVAASEGYSIIFEKSAAGIVYAVDAVDITGKILSQLK
jgi:outer membrane protein